MKLYNKYTKKLYSFSVNNTTLSSDNPLQFRKSLLQKKSIDEKIKVIDNKIQQNKGQYSLDRKTAKISALLSRNNSKYDFLTSKDVLPEKDFLEKAAAIKRFEYSLLGKKLKKQTSVAKI